MSSNLKVNSLVPATGTEIGIGTTGGSIDFRCAATFGGNVTIGGTLTYDEVINIDSIGIVTARSGLNVQAGQLDVGSNIKLGNAGVVTATTFVGALTGTASGNPTLTSGANNRVVTATGANALTGETGLTYDTQALRLNNTAANPQFHLTSADNGISELKFGDQSDLTRAVILYRSGSAGDALCFNGYNNTERLRITSDGKVGVGDFTSGTAVSQAFHVKGSEPKIYLEHTGGYDMTLTTSDGAGNNGITVNGGALSLAYNNKNIWMCRTGGYVSIGHMSPQQKLHLHEASSNGNFMQFTNSSTGATGNDGVLFGINSDEGGTIWNQENTYIRFGTNDTERLRIGSGGPHLFLGGTSSVNEITETSSSSGLVIGNTSMGNGGLAIINSTTGTGRIYFGDSVGGNAARNRGQINYYHNGDYMIFATAGSQRLRIDSNGLNLTPITNAARNAGVSTATGTLIYNSSTSTMQVYQGTKWDTLSNVVFAPTGGNATYTFGSYTVHAFTSNGNFVVNTSGTVDVLIVAGGGGGGATSRTHYNGAWAGGGGAGGVLYTTGVSVTAQTYSIVIGGGGAVGSNGSNSTALGLTAIGGGRGGGTTSSSNWTGGSGGSGGGGLGDQPGPYQGGSGTSGQGNAGGPGTDPGGNPYYEQGGGGGGAGETGNTDGIAFGGDGRDMSGQFGTTYGESGYFGGGGGGGQGTDNSNTTNEGGVGGGGNSGRGYQNSSLAPEAGAANTGGGGGAGGTGTGTGGAAGGSGIVLIRYLT